MQVELQLINALDALQQSVKLNGGETTTTTSRNNNQKYPLPFPEIQSCKASLTEFGDGGNLLRALRLYFKM
jgi:hypothetical protein